MDYDTTTTTVMPGNSKLQGNVGMWQLVFTVMAFQAPIVAFIAYLPVAIGLGNGLGTPAAILAAGVVVAIFSVGLTVMAKHLPNPGGFYAYVTAGLGREAGMAASCIALICYYFCVIALYALFGIGANSLVAGLFNGPDVVWWVWSLLAFGAIGILGYFRLEVSAKVLTVFLVCELALVVAYDIAVIARNGLAAFDPQPFSSDYVFSGSLGLAFMMALGIFGGFEATLIFREEVREPDRTIPRAIKVFVGLIAGLFALTGWLFINASGGEAVVALVANGTEATIGSTRDNLGTLGADLATIMLVTSSFAALLAAHNIATRYVYNLGADGVIPRMIGKAHPRHGSPYIASMTTSIAALAGVAPFALAGVDPNSFYATTAGIFSYALLVLLFSASVAIPVYLLRHPEIGGSVWATRVCPLLALVPLGIGIYLATKNFSFLIGGSQTKANWILLGIYGLCALGVALALIYKRTRPAVYASIGRQE